MRATAPLSQRFWPKVERTGSCWLWRGGLTPGGYGRIRAGRRDQSQLLAHRVAYELLVGPIPEGLQIDHLCRVRHCVNPEHLEVVTPRENTLRGETLPAENLRKTHCPQGHEYSGTNLLVLSNGERRCRICKRAITRRWRERHAA